MMYAVRLVRAKQTVTCPQLLQECFWTRLTPGMSFLERWLPCMHLALLDLQPGVQESFNTMMTDSFT